MEYLFVGILAAWLLFAGDCTKYWSQEGKSFEQTRRDLAVCRGEAARYADTRRTLGRGDFEQSFVQDCMGEKGYQFVPEKGLPMRIKRESSPVFGVPGIAGTID